MRQSAVSRSGGAYSPDAKRSERVWEPSLAGFTHDVCCCSALSATPCQRNGVQYARLCSPGFDCWIHRRHPHPLLARLGSTPPLQKLTPQLNSPETLTGDLLEPHSNAAFVMHTETQYEHAQRLVQEHNAQKKNHSLKTNYSTYHLKMVLIALKPSSSTPLHPNYQWSIHWLN